MLELALAEQPSVRERLARAEKDLKEAIDLLRPYAAAPEGPPTDLQATDPDLRYHIEIIDRALSEIAFILRPDDEALTAALPASSRNGFWRRP